MDVTLTEQIKLTFGCTRIVLADSGTGTVAYTDLPFCFSFLHQYVSPHPFVSGQKKSIAKRRCSSWFVMFRSGLLLTAVIRLQRFRSVACNSMSLLQTRSHDDCHIFCYCRLRQRNPNTGHRPLIL